MRAAWALVPHVVFWAGTLVCGCMDTMPISGTGDGDSSDRDPLYMTLIDDFEIVAEAATNISAGAWNFRIEPADAAADSGLDFVWDFGHSPPFHGIAQQYIYGSSGTYPVTVDGLDSTGQSIIVLTTTVEVFIAGKPNRAPVADAGDDVTVPEGSLGVLDGSGSRDDDSFSLTYRWRQTAGISAIIRQADQQLTSFLAPMVQADAILEFTLSVSDGINKSESVVVAHVLDVVTETPLEEPDEAVLTDPEEGEDDVDEDEEDDDSVADTEVGSSGLGEEVTEEGDEDAVGQSPGGSGSSTLPASTVLVHNAAELYAAADKSHTQSLNILIAGPITLNDSVLFSATSQSVVRILGLGDRPTITFNMTFDGDWTDQESYNRNGFEFTGKRAFVRNLTFTGYQLMGSALKINNPQAQLLDVADCDFHDIGNQWYPPRFDPPTSASDTIYTQCLGAHNQASAQINVTNCSFTRCATNQHRWSHCLYVSARCVSVMDNSFQQCGNPFEIGSKVTGAANNVLGNTVTSPALAFLPNGLLSAPYLATLGAGDYSAYLYNAVSGEFVEPWWGSPSPAVQFISQNDYTGLVYDGYWAVDAGVGYLTWSEWQALGFDAPPGGTIPASTVFVYDQAQLQAAAARTAIENLNIVIAGPMAITDTVRFPAGSNVVRLLGLGSRPTLTFNMTFDGQWGDPASYQRNGLEFHGKRAIIRNLTFSGYQVMGAVVAGRTTESLDVSDCAFQDIATQWHAPRVDPPGGAQDTIHGQCISADDGSGGHVSVTRCDFFHCATNQREWSYCLDVDARSASIAENSFDQCGNAFRLGAPSGEGDHSVFANVIAEPAQCRGADGQTAPPALCKLDAAARTAFIYNTVAGLYQTPWTGIFNPAVQYVGQNDYSQMTYLGVWAHSTSPLADFSWDDWQQLGFD